MRFRSLTAVSAGYGSAMPRPTRVMRSLLAGSAVLGLIGCAQQPGGSITPSASIPQAVASGTAAPTASVTDAPPSTDAPVAPSPTAAPDPGLTSDMQRMPWLPLGQWATVTADNLRVRYVPSLDTNLDSVVATVDAGTNLLVVGAGAISAEGFEWYEVAYDAAVGEDGYVHGIGIGFVAGATSTGDEQFIALGDESCPEAPVDVVTLAGLTDWALAHCETGSLVGLEGMLNQPIHGPITPFSYEPEWLWFGPWYLTDPDGVRAAFTMTSWSIGLRFPPGLDPSALRRGDLVRVDGHVRDPAASGCRMIGRGEEGAPEPSEAQQQQLRLECSAAFVVDAIEVTGHVELEE